LAAPLQLIMAIPRYAMLRAVKIPHLQLQIRSNGVIA